VPWDPILKLFFLKKVLVGLVNSAHDPSFKRQTHVTSDVGRNPNNH